ncbi:hypothetical protein CAOG_06888 [Capsaspora owczarzaki ATCC 30864]|uniref:Grh/CP2 DB domain-containing protein n=1 Tax=Capsaspora owczarzaki (strain ATCC 30864) TaxID=595528 RepID=A0A0D2WV33_CAPO3|nr:hypothetical protein CAOG_06888 [Capsaspora owczarzaki ATCC 30864]KJE96585.1 hypothetical protein CAOG_006888 [Capsaspora owczarzaki ATCC 30864]|eukprot:XP_004344509.1 hypothetical protein CAOG_06888 [Capsaspora owczarzaki ATCC 30864]
MKETSVDASQSRGADNDAALNLRALSSSLASASPAHAIAAAAGGGQTGDAQAEPMPDAAATAATATIEADPLAALVRHEKTPALPPSLRFVYELNAKQTRSVTELPVTYLDRQRQYRLTLQALGHDPLLDSASDQAQQHAQEDELWRQAPSSSALPTSTSARPSSSSFASIPTPGLIDVKPEVFNAKAAASSMIDPADSTSSSSSALRSIIYVHFHDHKDELRETELWNNWVSETSQTSAVEIASSMSNGIAEIKPVGPNAVSFSWSAARGAAIYIVLNCLSTEVGASRNSKGVPLRLHIDTYRSSGDAPAVIGPNAARGPTTIQGMTLISSAFTMIKVYKKGAEKQFQNDLRRNQGLPLSVTTILSPAKAVPLPGGGASFVLLPKSPVTSVATKPDARWPAAPARPLGLPMDSPFSSKLALEQQLRDSADPERFLLSPDSLSDFLPNAMDVLSPGTIDALSDGLIQHASLKDYLLDDAIRSGHAGSPHQGLLSREAHAARLPMNASSGLVEDRALSAFDVSSVSSSLPGPEGHRNGSSSRSAVESHKQFLAAEELGFESITASGNPSSGDFPATTSSGAQKTHEVTAAWPSVREVDITNSPPFLAGRRDDATFAKKMAANPATNFGELRFSPGISPQFVFQTLPNSTTTWPLNPSFLPMVDTPGTLPGLDGGAVYMSGLSTSPSTRRTASRVSIKAPNGAGFDSAFSPSQLQTWLLRQRFSASVTDGLQDFSGEEVAALSRADLREIVGDIPAIRLQNLIKGSDQRAVSQSILKCIMVQAEGEQLYRRVYLQSTNTLESLSLGIATKFAVRLPLRRLCMTTRRLDFKVAGLAKRLKITAQSPDVTDLPSGQPVRALASAEVEAAAAGLHIGAPTPETESDRSAVAMTGDAAESLLEALSLTPMIPSSESHRPVPSDARSSAAPSTPAQKRRNDTPPSATSASEDDASMRSVVKGAPHTATASPLLGAKHPSTNDKLARVASVTDTLQDATTIGTNTVHDSDSRYSFSQMSRALPAASNQLQNSPNGAAGGVSTAFEETAASEPADAIFEDDVWEIDEDVILHEMDDNSRYIVTFRINDKEPGSMDAILRPK